VLYDLIVVGGSAAGSTCARSAALLGLDVLLLEKSYHPRKKAWDAFNDDLLEGPHPIFKSISKQRRTSP